MSPELSPQQMKMPISRLITRIAFSELRGWLPSHGRVQQHAWSLRCMYQRADWRDANIMLWLTKCKACGPIAKWVALELRITA